MEQVSCAAMEVKTETQRSLEWQLNELQKGLHDAEALDSSISDARALSETVAANMERGVGRHDHESATSILDEALKEIEVDSRPDVSDMKAVLLQPSEPVLPEVPCSQMSVQLPQTIVPNTSPENPNIKVDLPSVPLSFKIDPQRAMVANASDIRHIRVEVPKPALPIEIEQPLAVVTNTSDSSHIKYELPKMSLPIKVESPMTVMATTSESTRMKVDMPKQAQLPIKVETPHNVLTVEVPKVVSVVPTSCATSAAAVTAVSIPQAITLSSVANSPTVQGGTYRLKASGALGNPVVGAPLMVTGVVIPRAPLSSNLISFVDASGNMQLAAVASPIMNPTIQIRPGVVVNSAPPLVVRPPAPQIVSPSGPLGTIVPVSTLSTVQPPIFKSTVRAILPNKTTVKTIYPIKGGTTTMLNSEPKINDVQAVVRTSPAILEEPEEEQPPPPTLQPSIKEPSSTESKSEHHKNDSTSIVPSDSSPPIIEPTPLSKPLINEVCPPTKPEDEDKVNDVIWKILSVSSSQGVSKAGELAKTNLFNLVKTETNVVITAPSTAVQDILEELKKQFPDKKFVINYNASNTASSNLKNLVNQAATGKKNMKPTIAKPLSEKSSVKRALHEDKSAPSAKRKKTQTLKAKALANMKAAQGPSTSKGGPKRAKVEKVNELPSIPKPAATYRSARLRGEKAPELFSGKKRKEEISAPPKLQKEFVTPPVRTRGRPRKDRSSSVQSRQAAEQAIMSSIRDVEVKLDQLPEDFALQGGSVRVGDGTEFISGAPGEGEDSVGSSTSSGVSGGTSVGYNTEIRVGDEFQAKIPSFLVGKPPENYPDHADIIYHPDKGLLNATRPEGSRFCQDFPLYDFVDWSHQDKKMFKRYLGTYKTKFGKYLAVLPHKRLLDIIDHYYSTHSPARDYVLPKKSKHYYLVSKSKQMIAPKGVFGILNEKRKVLPNRRFCANPNIFLYEDALPTRRPKDVTKDKPAAGFATSSTSGTTGTNSTSCGSGSSGASSSKAAKTDANEKPTKVVKFEDIMKPLVSGTKPSNNKLETADKAVSSSAESSDNESARSLVDDALGYAFRKSRPSTGNFDNDVTKLVSNEAVAELPTIDENVGILKDEIVSLKKIFQRNKAELAQMESEQKRIAKTVEQVTKAIGKARKVTDEWSKEDRLLTIQAFKSFGKDFRAVSKLVGTKSEQAVKQFYETNNQRYGLDQPIVPATETPAVASTGSSSPVKSGPDSPVRAPRPMPSILRRKISVKPLNV